MILRSTNWLRFHGEYILHVYLFGLLHKLCIHKSVVDYTKYLLSKSPSIVGDLNAGSRELVRAACGLTHGCKRQSLKRTAKQPLTARQVDEGVDLQDWYTDVYTDKQCPYSSFRKPSKTSTPRGMQLSGLVLIAFVSSALTVMPQPCG